MARTPPGSEPDPMARIVDRLLAQLPGLQAEPVYPQTGTTRGPSTASITPATRRLHEPTQSESIGVWIRVIMGLSLGIMMSAWPYDMACGLPLAGYLAAVCTVVLAGLWGAGAAWRFRSGLAHVVGLILVLYGLSLGVAELLPRSGYTLHQATWLCESEGPAYNPSVN